MVTEEEHRKRELPINRAIYQLRSGVPEQKITAASLGVPNEELADIVVVAKKRMVQNDQNMLR